MTTKLDRSKCSTSRSETILAIVPAVANLLSAAVAQGEGKRFGEVFGRGGFQVDGLGGYCDSALFHPRIRLGETARGRGAVIPREIRNASSTHEAGRLPSRPASSGLEPGIQAAPFGDHARARPVHDETDSGSAYFWAFPS
jgi:hypothetical protein